MNAIGRRSLAVALTALAAAVVFSPLVAALLSGGRGFTFHGVVRPTLGTICVAAIAAVIASLLGFPFAMVVDRARARIRRVCWALAVVALIVPPYIVAESTVVLFGPAGKLSRGVALLVGLGPSKSDSVERARFTVSGFVYTTPAAGIVLGGCYFPIVALAVGSANRRLDRRMLEAARLMQGRVGAVNVVARVLVPPTFGAAMIVFAIAMTESVVPQLLRVPNVSESIYESVQEGNLAAAARLGLPILPLIVLSGIAGALILLRVRAASTAGMEGEVPKFSGFPARIKSDFIAVIATMAATVPAILVPIVSLTWLLATAKVAAAVSASEHRVLRVSGFADALRGAWDLARDDAIRTVILATLTATISTALAIALVRSSTGRRWNITLGSLGAGLATPAAIVALGMIVLWNRRGLQFVYQSEAIVVLAWLARFFPVGLLLTLSALSRVPAEIEQAAALMGRGAARRFVEVVMPSAAPGLVAAWLGVYVLSATEVGATLLITPAGAPLLAPSVVNLMRRGQDPEIAACQALLLAVVIAPPLVLAITHAFFRIARGGQRP